MNTSLHENLLFAPQLQNIHDTLTFSFSLLLFFVKSYGHVVKPLVYTVFRYGVLHLENVQNTVLYTPA